MSTARPAEAGGKPITVAVTAPSKDSSDGMRCTTRTSVALMALVLHHVAQGGSP